jgi:hypothetical protein
MTKQFHLNYRPTSFWASEDAPRHRIHRIKGQDRREAARRALQDGEPDQLADSEYDESLSDAVRDFRGSIHPSLMGGEYLPDFMDEEIEIARVSLASVLGDVISIRARREGGRVQYRIVDEYETVFRCEPSTSADPLTMGELLGLIDSVTGEGMYPEWGRGLTNVYRDLNSGTDPTELVDFVRVSSELYPELEHYYAEEAQAWLEERKRRPLQESEW